MKLRSHILLQNIRRIDNYLKWNTFYSSGTQLFKANTKEKTNKRSMIDFFSTRVIDIWDKLPQTILNAPSIEILIKQAPKEKGKTFIITF